jgi:hypothetical protein
MITKQIVEALKAPFPSLETAFTEVQDLGSPVWHR